MKKIFLAVMAVVALCACNGERGYVDYRGLSLGMSAKAMCDSLVARGYELDTNYTNEQAYVLNNAQMLCRVDIMHYNDTVSDVLESYAASYNDSTSELWQVMRDSVYELQGRMPEMTHRSDLHKEALFQNEDGTIIVKLLNTYSPTLSIRYSTNNMIRE
jgi:hypothetical protein